MEVHPLKISEYREIVVLTGAGISVASGLHTYRGKGGLWEVEDIEAHTTAAAIEAYPHRVWEFFAKLRKEVAKASPNAAHDALAEAAQLLPDSSRLTVITQNVDGLHSAAGSQNVLELHGTLHRSRCTSCEFSRSEPLAEAPSKCPACPSCSSPLRPDVVLFGEEMPPLAEWESKKRLRDCDLFIAVGTSGSVSPASNFVRSAKYAGARTVFVNLEAMSPNNPSFDATYLGAAEVMLPKLLLSG